LFAKISGKGRVGDGTNPKQESLAMSNVDVVSVEKLNAATRAFAAASALRKARIEVGFSEHHCSGCHHDQRNDLAGAELGGWKDFEANHGRMGSRFVRTDLGDEHEELLKDLDDLAGRLQAFGMKVLGVR
jgi:hypothetical protein